jgi:hypothetical protein
MESSRPGGPRDLIVHISNASLDVYSTWKREWRESDVCPTLPSAMRCTKKRYKEKTSMTEHQSHRPSFQPVCHLSSHLEQSNSFFPSLRFTSLCASHIQLPNSERLFRRGVLRPLGSFIQDRKSSAQTQQGYSLEKRDRKDRMSFCCSGEALSGYVAVIEWRSVQVLRPRASTSGGQSGGTCSKAVVA